MQMLTTAKDIHDSICHLLDACTSCEIAVAWASHHPKQAFECLKENRNKITRMVVGTHFCQTAPQFLSAFLNDPRVRFVRDTTSSSVFHPKVYLFQFESAAPQFVVGSSNFTSGGLHTNDEIAVCCSNAAAFSELQQQIDTYWNKAQPVSQAAYEAYCCEHKRKQKHLKQLKGQTSGGSTTPFGSVRRMDWGTFVSKVQNDPVHSMIERLRVIKDCQELFALKPHFEDLPQEARYAIAGLNEYRGIRHGMFGFMSVARQFRNAAKLTDRLKHLSAALDRIPDDGLVERDMYLSYIDEYRKAFPEKHHGVGTATRLLAMKRPDQFVCVAGPNVVKLKEAFALTGDLLHGKYRYEWYWDWVIEQILVSVWWNSEKPVSDDERKVWNARAAFLDSHFYEPKK